MKYMSFGVAGALLALTACQTVPPSNPALEEARTAVNTASADPAVTTAAAPELQRARDALVAAESAWNDGDEPETRSRAYIAKQRAQIASEVGARYTVEQRLQQTAVERERIRTEARTREAQAAEARAAEANRDASAARQEAQAAQAQAQSQATQAQVAQDQAQAERRRSEDQQRQLDAERERANRMQHDLESLAAKSTARGVVVTLQDVLFDSGKAQLRSGALRSLERVAGVLKNYPERRLLIEGFTDSQGSESYNLELARRRADTVKQQLQALGIPDQRVETHAYGEAFPIADNETAEGRQQNRRVELLFSDGRGQFPSR
jgi:outer membrane protein OmpA-like peptidoglycan-associated protein